MKIHFSVIILSLFVYLSFGHISAAEGISIEELGKQAITSAFSGLNAKLQDTNMACLTNAGYVKYNGRSTRSLYDVISQNTAISLGKGNLLPVHTRWNETIWFAFVHKKSEKELLLTYITPNKHGISSTKPINVYVDKNQSFKIFKEVLGTKAFSIVTFANGWADGVPETLINSALFHDHLCCGVFSGYFTVNFIKKHIALKEKEKYIYIGAPAWCQDDYIITHLNLTPGKGGYHTMKYPWYRPWKTSEKVYEKLGGIIIRFDDIIHMGQACLLCFDWREDDFKQFVEMPDLKLDWKGQPWLHVWYNKFFLKHLDRPENFVSVLKIKELKNQNDLNRLIKMGTNPLEEILGQDKLWTSDLN